jgi:hypothetical protein
LLSNKNEKIKKENELEKNKKKLDKLNKLKEEITKLKEMKNILIKSIENLQNKSISEENEENEENEEKVEKLKKKIYKLSEENKKFLTEIKELEKMLDNIKKQENDKKIVNEKLSLKIEEMEEKRKIEEEKKLETEKNWEKEKLANIEKINLLKKENEELKIKIRKNSGENLIFNGYNKKGRSQSPCPSSNLSKNFEQQLKQKLIEEMKLKDEENIKLIQQILELKNELRDVNYFKGEVLEKQVNQLNFEIDDCREYIDQLETDIIELKLFCLKNNESNEKKILELKKHIKILEYKNSFYEKTIEEFNQEI